MIKDEQKGSVTQKKIPRQPSVVLTRNSGHRDRKSLRRKLNNSRRNVPGRGGSVETGHSRPQTSFMQHEPGVGMLETFRNPAKMSLSVSFDSMQTAWTWWCDVVAKRRDAAPARSSNVEGEPRRNIIVVLVGVKKDRSISPRSVLVITLTLSLSYSHTAGLLCKEWGHRVKRSAVTACWHEEEVSNFEERSLVSHFYRAMCNFTWSSTERLSGATKVVFVLRLRDFVRTGRS